MASDTYNIKIGGGVKPEVFASLNRLTGSIGAFGASFAAAALPLGTIFSGAALTGFIGGAMRAADALADLREETGMAMDMLGGIKLAADIKGLGDIDLPMRKFSAAVREAQIEGSKFNQIFKQIGVDPMQDLDKVLLDVADKFASWEDGINKLGIAEDLFGTKQAQFIQLLNMGSDGLKEQSKAFKDSHPDVEEAAKLLDEYNKQTALLKSNLEGIAQTLGTKVAGALNESISGWKTLIAFFKQGMSGGDMNLQNFMAQRGLVGIADALSAGRTSAARPNGSAPNTGGKAADPIKEKRELIDIQIEENRLMTERSLLETVVEEKKQFLVETGMRKEIELINERRLAFDVEHEEKEKWELQDKRDLLRLEQEHMAYLDRKLQRERAHQQQLARIRSIQVQGVSDMFGNMATVAEAFGKKGLIAYKAFATAQAVIDTARAAIAAYSATVGIPYVGPILAPIAAGAAIAAGAVQIAKINGAFMEGGYTGDYATNRVAGVVHGQEYVIPANRVSEFGVGFFDGIRNGTISAPDAAAAGGGVNANFAVLNSRNDWREFMATEGVKMAYDYANRRQRSV